MRVNRDHIDGGWAQPAYSPAASTLRDYAETMGAAGAARRPRAPLILAGVGAVALLAVGFLVISGGSDEPAVTPGQFQATAQPGALDPAEDKPGM